VIAAAGGTGTLGNISLEWTLGDLSTQSVIGGHTMYTEGFHQPTLIVKIIEKEIQSAPLDSDAWTETAPNIKVYPNPVGSELNVVLDGVKDIEFRAQLIDVNGKLIMQKIANTRDQTMQFDMSQHANGLYVLHFVSIDGVIIKAFEIVKIQ
jgi:hypothetical protein